MSGSRAASPRARRLVVQVVLLPVVALVVLAASVTWQVRDVFRSVEQMQHTHDFILGTSRVLQLLIDMETGARGYALTRDARFLDPFLQSSRPLHEELGRLRELAEENPEDLPLVDEIERTYLEWDDHSRTLIARVRDGASRDALDETPGKRRMDHMRELLGTLSARETERRRQRIAGVHARERAIALFSVSLATSLGLLLAFVGRRQVVGLAREHERNLQALEARSDELQRSEELFRLTVEGVRDYAICLVDPAGRVVRWNAGAERLYGYGAGEAIGRPLSSLYPEDGRAKVDETLQVALRQDVAHEEADQLGRDGRRFRAQIVLRPLRDESGLLGFVKVVRDVTEQRRMESEREAMLGELRDAVAARDEFLSIASHELRTPLTSLLLQLQGLQRVAAMRGVDADVRRRLDLGERQATRLGRLIDDLLDVSRIRTGRLRLEREHVDLVPFVRELLDRSSESARSAGCELVLTAPESLAGSFDRLRLEQVVTNLLANALKYGPGQPIEVTLVRDGRMARLIVRDHGIGIEEHAIARIFERFERAVSSRSYGGLGLGLYITQQIVTAHDGTIRVESTPGEGTTFTVELPLEP